MSAEVFPSADLHANGWTGSTIDQAVRAGRLVRVRRGWFALSGADPEQLLAVQARGALTCVSALLRYRVWVPAPPGRPHVRLGRGGMAGPAIIVCRSTTRRSVAAALDPPADALRAALRCQPLELGVAMLDSVLNQGVLGPSEVEALVREQSLRAQGVLRRHDGRAQSGTESLVRLRLTARGVAVRSQVQIRDVGRVDLVVGDRLVIECDSRAHHTGADTYAADRRRDRALVTQGYVVMRLTYEDVMYRWEAALADILAVVRADRHRWRSGRRV